MKISSKVLAFVLVCMGAMNVEGMIPPSEFAALCNRNGGALCEFGEKDFEISGKKGLVKDKLDEVKGIAEERMMDCVAGALDQKGAGKTATFVQHVTFVQWAQEKIAAETARREEIKRKAQEELAKRREREAEVADLRKQEREARRLENEAAERNRKARETEAAERNRKEAREAEAERNRRAREAEAEHNRKAREVETQYRKLLELEKEQARRAENENVSRSEYYNTPFKMVDGKKKMSPTIFSLKGEEIADDLGFFDNKVVWAGEHQKQAFEKFSEAAARGDPSAKCDLAAMYLNGIYVEQSFENAFKLLSEAAAKYYAPALCGLGGMYLTAQYVGHNPRTARDLFTLAAAKGDAKAQLMLGNMFYFGQYSATDWRALESYLNYAEQGHDTAQCNLAALYFCLNAKKECNLGEAFKCFWKAADQGLRLAKYIVWTICTSGQSVAPDSKKFSEWCVEIVDNGYKYGMDSFEKMNR